MSELRNNFGKNYAVIDLNGVNLLTGEHLNGPAAFAGVTARDTA